MAVSVGTLLGYTVEATDGELGTLFDVFTDEDEWKVRYLVVDTGKWLPGRKVMLMPASVSEVDVPRERILIEHSREEIEKSPNIDVAKPVTRREELDLHRYYGRWPHWAPYEVGGGPHKMQNLLEKGEEFLKEEGNLSGHLRSIRDLHGYVVELEGEDIGKLEHLVMDESAWSMTHVVVQMGHLAKAKSVLLPVDDVIAVEPLRRAVDVRGDKEAIADQPEFQDDMLSRMGR